MAEPTDYGADLRLRQTLDFVEWLRNASPLDTTGGAFSQFLRDAHSSSTLQYERSPNGIVVRSVRDGDPLPPPEPGNVPIPSLPAGSCFWDTELDRTLSQLRSIAAARGFDTRRDAAIIRAIPTGLINGAAWALPSGTLIAIDDGLIVGIRHLIDTAVLFLPLEEGTENTVSVPGRFAAFAERLRADNGEHARLRSMLRAALIYRNPLLTVGSPLEGIQEQVAASLRRTAELFVVAHEYSHLLLGHFQRSSFSRKRHFTADVAVNEACLDWQPEFAADRLGIELALHTELETAAATGDCESVHTGYWAVGLLLGVISIMEEVLATPPSHPPAEARHTALRNFLNDRCATGRFFDEEDAVPIGTLDVGWWLIRELWQRSRPAFEEDRRDPQPPVAEVMRYLQLLRKGLRNQELTEEESVEFLRLLGEES